MLGADRISVCHVRAQGYVLHGRVSGRSAIQPGSKVETHRGAPRSLVRRVSVVATQDHVVAVLILVEDSGRELSSLLQRRFQRLDVLLVVGTQAVANLI